MKNEKCLYAIMCNGKVQMYVSETEDGNRYQFYSLKEDKNGRLEFHPEFDGVNTIPDEKERLVDLILSKNRGTKMLSLYEAHPMGDLPIGDLRMRFPDWLTTDRKFFYKDGGWITITLNGTTREIAFDQIIPLVNQQIYEPKHYAVLVRNDLKQLTYLCDNNAVATMVFCEDHVDIKLRDLAFTETLYDTEYSDGRKCFITTKYKESVQVRQLHDDQGKKYAMTIDEENKCIVVHAITDTFNRISDFLTYGNDIEASEGKYIYVKYDSVQEDVAHIDTFMPKLIQLIDKKSTIAGNVIITKSKVIIGAYLDNGKCEKLILPDLKLSEVRQLNHILSTDENIPTTTLNFDCENKTYGNHKCCITRFKSGIVDIHGYSDVGKIHYELIKSYTIDPNPFILNEPILWIIGWNARILFDNGIDIYGDIVLDLCGVSVSVFDPVQEKHFKASARTEIIIPNIIRVFLGCASRYEFTIDKQEGEEDCSNSIVIEREEKQFCIYLKYTLDRSRQLIAQINNIDIVL